MKLVDSRHPYQLLFIDDDSATGEVYKKACEEAGVQMTLFHDANGDLVERVLGVMPDLISLDIVMPGRDGFEALKSLKSDPRTRQIPVFVLSNLGQKPDKEMSLKLGAVDHIVSGSVEARSIILKYILFLNGREP